MTILVLQDGAKINVQWAHIPKIHEQVKLDTKTFTVANVIHVVENNYSQKIEVHLIT